MASLLELQKRIDELRERIDELYKYLFLVNIALLPYNKRLLNDHLNTIKKSHSDKRISGYPPVFIQQISKDVWTAKNVKRLKLTTEAMVLIFGHALLESLVNDLIALSIEHLPEVWIKRIRSRKMEVTIQDLTPEKMAKLIQKEILKYARQCTNRNLAQRIEVLFEVFKPGVQEAEFTKFYTFDKSRIRRIDEMRNFYAHNKGELKPIETIWDDLHYLHETCNFIILLFFNRMNESIDRNHSELKDGNPFPIDNQAITEDKAIVKNNLNNHID